MTDLARLMSDDPEVYMRPAKSSVELVRFMFKGKMWRAVHVENPTEFRGLGWFFYDGAHPKFGFKEPDHSLTDFVADPSGFASRFWPFKTNPGWSRPGVFSDKRFEYTWENAAFISFEEVV